MRGTAFESITEHRIAQHSLRQLEADIAALEWLSRERIADLLIDVRTNRLEIRTTSTSVLAEHLDRRAVTLPASARVTLVGRLATPTSDLYGGLRLDLDDPPQPGRYSLLERIEGEHIDDDDVAGIEAAGAAFAELDEVLATLQAGRAVWNGSIESVHPLVNDLSALKELGPECADFVRRMAKAPSDVRASIQPRQVIHGDFAFTNLLLKDGRVVGVLDLEFLAEDARAAELATALRLVLSKGLRDLIWRPLLRGYLSRLQLTDVEIRALPTLVAQHEAVVIAWWLGRYRSGKADRSSLDEHVVRALALEPWLAGHADEVVAEAHEIARVSRAARSPAG